MPVVDFSTVFTTMTRLLVVAVAHVSIVLIVLLAFPLWILLAFKPAALGQLAVRVLAELRRWSAASLAGAGRDGS